MHSNELNGDLFGPKEPSPVEVFVYPKDYATCVGRVLAKLLRREQLTGLDCLSETHSIRLAHHVYDLRERGWPVETERRDVTTADHGRVANIAFYSLPDWAIEHAGERGRRYADAALRHG